MKYLLIILLLFTGTVSGQNLKKSANNRIASHVFTAAATFCFVKSAKFRIQGYDPSNLETLGYFFALCAAATEGASIYYLWKADKK